MNLDKSVVDWTYECEIFVKFYFAFSKRNRLDTIPEADERHSQSVPYSIAKTQTRIFV